MSEGTFLMRRFLKLSANTIALLLVLPVVGVYKLSAAIVNSERVFPGFSQVFSLIPGIAGSYVRRAFYRCVLPACGEDVCICFGTVFSHPAATIGDRVYIGVGCMIGDVTLDADVLIGSHVSIINGRRQHGIERLDVPVREQPGEYPRVMIGEDSWIGDRAIVMADLGKHSVMGAGAVVTKAMPDFAIAAGNPAQIKGFREASVPAAVEASAVLIQTDVAGSELSSK
jgi:acetyltransferase-like isoleucine patch superfamily enzyme